MLFINYYYYFRDLTALFSMNRINSKGNLDVNKILFLFNVFAFCCNKNNI